MTAIHWLVLLLPLVALWKLVPGLPPTGDMIAIALTMFVLIKWHALAIYLSQGQGKAPRPTRREYVFWFVGWAGLDPRAFFAKAPSADTDRARGDTNRPRHHPHEGLPRQLAFVLLKISLGVFLFTWLAPKTIGLSPWLAGWIAMVGIVTTLHFGVIHLSAMIWNARGRNVKPIMNAPIMATTVSEFWGKRWNLAFRDYAHVCLFSPLARSTQPTVAVAVGFLFSGIIHDLAISVPAGGGWGWPTLYFVIQGTASLLERQMKKQGWNLGNHWLGRVWTIAWVAGPAMILFHRPFVMNVILPMIQWLE